MFVVHDVTTDTMIGPFELEDDAVSFTIEAGDLLNDISQELSIYEMVEPQQWAFDNLAVEIAETSPYYVHTKEEVNV